MNITEKEGILIPIAIHVLPDGNVRVLDKESFASFKEGKDDSYPFDGTLTYISVRDGKLIIDGLTGL